MYKETILTGSVAADGLLGLSDDTIVRIASYGLDATDLSNLELTCKRFGVSRYVVGNDKWNRRKWSVVDEAARCNLQSAIAELEGRNGWRTLLLDGWNSFREKVDAKTSGVLDKPSWIWFFRLFEAKQNAPKSQIMCEKKGCRCICTVKKVKKEGQKFWLVRCVHDPLTPGHHMRLNRVHFQSDAVGNEHTKSFLPIIP